MTTAVKPRIFAPLTELEERIGKQVVNAAFQVHKKLGPGLLESAYEACFSIELKKSPFLNVQSQVTLPIIYEGVTVSEAFRIDVIVNNLVICELKAVEQITPIHKAQLLTYLKLSGKRLGYLINFNLPMIKDGINRFVL